MSFLKKVTASFFITSALLLPFLAFATAIYVPGQTLDPTCSPSNPDCTVTSPAASGANSDITSLSALLSATSSYLYVGTQAILNSLISTNASTTNLYTDGLTLSNLNGLLFGTNGVISSVSTTSLLGNYVPYSGASSNLNLGTNQLLVSGTTTLATTSLTQLTANGATLFNNLLSVIGTSTLATTSISNLSLGNGLTNTFLVADANGNITATTSPFTSFPTFGYASSTFATYAYASSTFPSYGYASSTFVNYSYASSTFAALTGATFSGSLGVTGTSTFATTTISNLGLGNGLNNSFLAVDASGNVVATTSPLSVAAATSTYVPYSYASSSFLSLDQTISQTISSGTPTFAAGLNTVSIGNSGYTNSINLIPQSLTAVYNDLIPAMTSDTAPSGTASASSYAALPNYDAYKAFDHNTTVINQVWAANTTSGWLQYQFPSAQVVNGYQITSEVGQGGSRAPANWTFQGSNDGSTWTTLDTQTSITSWTDGQTKSFAFTNSTSYLYYRINVASIDSGSVLSIEELVMANLNAPVPEIAFNTDNTERMRILQNGNITVETNLGVGTTTPVAKFEVYGTAGNNAIANFASSSNQSVLYIAANGNVGIGTTTPSTALSVIGTTTSSGINITSLANSFLAVDANGNVVATTTAQFLSTSSASTLYVPYTGANANVDLNNKSLANVSTLSVGSATVPTGGVAYFNGNVGIGTTTPAQKLDVYGSALLENAGSVALTLNDNSSTQIPTINLQQGGTTRASIQGGRGVLNVMDFFTGGANRMTIDQYGNVGIGTSNPSTKLQVNGGAQFNTASIGAVPQANNMLFVEDSGSYSSTSTGNIGGNFSVHNNPSATSTANQFANQSAAYWLGTTTSPGGYSFGNYTIGAYGGTGLLGNNIGGRFGGYSSGTGTITTNIGGEFDSINEGGGYMTNSYDGYFTTTANNNSTITNNYGLDVENPGVAAGGAIGNNYGIYIKNQTAGTTANYALYSQGGTNYFGGNVGIGTTTPGTALSVIGTTTSSGINITSLANSFLAVDANGNVVATTSPLSVANASSTYLKLDGSNGPLTGDLNISTSSPEFRLTDGNYTRLVRTSANDQATLYNQVSVIAADGTGGTITHVGGYTIHTFTSSGTFTPVGSVNAQLLVVGGGGGGGILGGGGGGGGVVSTTTTISGAISVVVGTGGAAAIGTQSAIGTNGATSSFGTINALGGGAGGSQNSVPANNGGSGGGGGSQTNLIGGSGTVGQGNNGGTGSGSALGGGGGGGCNAVGSNASGTTGGNGGAGCTNSISGSSVTYGGGGGGGAQSGIGGTGGAGGGGSGTGSSAAAQNGTANTGGGGGSSGYSGSYGTAGNGGSGIVIIKYNTASSVNEIPLVSSQDSITPGEYGVNTFGATYGATHLNGDALYFDVNGTNKGLFDANGNFAIGTSTADATLSVYGSGSGAIANFASSSNQSVLYIGANGNLGIGTTTATQALSVIGNVTATQYGTPYYSQLVTASTTAVNWNNGSVQNLDFSSSTQNNTVAYYKFENNYNDAMGGSAGVPSGSISFSTAVSAAGIDGGSYGVAKTTPTTADGSYVTFPLSDINTTEGTVEFAFKTGTDITDNQDIIWLGGNGGAANSRTIEYGIISGTLKAYMGIGSGFNLSSGITANTWYYGAVTWSTSGNYTKFWLGNLNPTTGVTSGMTSFYSTSTLPLWGTVTNNEIFNGFNGLDRFAGQGLDVLRFSNVALSSFPTMSAAVVIPVTFNNPVIGARYTVTTVNNVSGNVNVLWPANVIWPNGIVGSMTQTAGAKDTFTFVYNGTDYVAQSASPATIIASAIYPAANSTKGLQFESASGATTILNIDTINGLIGIGTNAPTGLLTLNDTGTSPLIVISGTTTPTINIASIGNSATGTLAITDANNNVLFQLSDYATSTGGIAGAGAFIDNLSSLDEEFNADTNTTLLTTNGKVGDSGTWSMRFNGGGNYSTPQRINGVADLGFQTSTGVGSMLAYGENSANGGAVNAIFNESNLPIMQVKFMPATSSASATFSASTDYYIGLMDTLTAPTTADTFPANGIFVWSDNTTAASGGSMTLQGVVRNSGVTVGTVSCTGNYTYGTSVILRMQAESSTTIHFFANFNVANGLNFTDCGTVVATSTIAANLAPEVIFTHNETIARDLAIDYIRLWQDDTSNATSTNPALTIIPTSTPALPNTNLLTASQSDIQALSNSQIFSSLITVAQQFGSVIDSIGNNMVHFKNVITDTFTVGTQTKPAGITIYDTVTGNPYCVEVVNGSLVNIPGDCSSQNTNLVSSSSGSVTTSTHTGTTVSQTSIPVTTSTTNTTASTTTSTSTASSTITTTSTSTTTSTNTVATSTATTTASSTTQTASSTPVDTLPPVITLNGSATITLTVGDTYTELGATATDDVDGTDTVTTSGTVDTTTAGTYTITYTATDAAGNSSTATRTVQVNAAVTSATSTSTTSTTTSTTTATSTSA